MFTEKRSWRSKWRYLLGKLSNAVKYTPEDERFRISFFEGMSNDWKIRESIAFGLNEFLNVDLAAGRRTINDGARALLTRRDAKRLGASAGVDPTA